MHIMTCDQKDYSDILGLVDIVYSGLSLKKIQNIIVKQLPEIFHSESSVFFLRDIDHSINYDYTAQINLSWRYIKQYVDYYSRFDPFINPKSERLAWRESDVMSHLQMHQHRYYHEFLEPQHIRHMLILSLEAENTILGHIGVCRQDEGSRCFSVKDLFKAQLFAGLISHRVHQINIKNQNSGVTVSLGESSSLTESAACERLVLPLCGRHLTSREREITYLICRGLSNKEIGDRLYISLPTVVTHVHHIFEKLEVTSRSKLACAVLQ